MNFYYSKYLDEFLESRNKSLTVHTIRNKKYHILNMLIYFEDNGIGNIKDVSPGFVYEYIQGLDYASQTISAIEFNIREFFDFLYEKGYCSLDGRKIFPVIFTNKRDRILSFYSTEEIKQIIKQINLKSNFGVRDKCLILLAAQTGLRASDIIYLKLDEIKWDKDIIQKVQGKTKFNITVPLPKNIKLLLTEYIKERRPKCDLEYVFINPKNLQPYSSSNLFQILNRYIKKSKIDIKNRKHGPHSLRHSLATRLLSNNTPMPVITGILGHKNINTTSKYLSIDIEELRALCLEVPTNGIL